MKRKALEKLWILLVVSMVISTFLLGLIAVYDERPLEKIRYFFVIGLVGAITNLIMMYLVCNAKE